jgi:DNA-binding NtrC family response regulator
MKTIFIIDDDPSRQKLMNHHLTSMGFIVRSFFSGAEFDEVAEKPFLIILDHNVDGDPRSGLYHLKRIRRRMRSVPVIYMTNDIDREGESEAKKIGAFDLIPQDSASLIRIRTALDRLMTQPARSSWIKKIWNVLTISSAPTMGV